MNSIFRGTTPLLRFQYPYKYEEITKLTVTFSQDGIVLFKIRMGDDEIDTIEDFGVSILLTQEETNLFKHTFSMQAQVKLMTIDGDVWAGDIQNYQIHRILDTDLFDMYDESGEES